MKKILEAFISKYSDSQDPQMSAEAKEIQEELQKHSLQASSMQLLVFSEVVFGPVWHKILKVKLERQKFSDFFRSRQLLLVYSYLSSGTISWSGLTSVQQVEFISSCVNTVVMFVCRGISGMVALRWCLGVVFFLVRT